MADADLLTTTEAVDYLSARGLTLSDETLRRWAKAGQLPHLRLPSGRVRFRPRDLDAIGTPEQTS